MISKEPLTRKSHFADVALQCAWVVVVVVLVLCAHILLVFAEVAHAHLDVAAIKLSAPRMKPVWVLALYAVQTRRLICTSL